MSRYEYKYEIKKTPDHYDVILITHHINGEFLSSTQMHSLNPDYKSVVEAIKASDNLQKTLAAWCI